MCSFKATVIVSIEYSQSSVPATVLYIFLTLKVSAIHFYQRTFFQRIPEHQSPWIQFFIKASIIFKTASIILK